MKMNLKISIYIYKRNGESLLTRIFFCESHLLVWKCKKIKFGLIL